MARWLMVLVRWLVVRAMKYTRKDTGGCGAVMVVCDKDGVVTVPCLETTDHAGDHVFSVRKSDMLQFHRSSYLKARTQKILCKGGIR